MSTVTSGRITATEFAKLPRPANGAKQELVRGVVVTMSNPGPRQGKLEAFIATALVNYVCPRELGTILTESACLTENDPDTVRGPDISFWTPERMPLDYDSDAYVRNPADLCIEILSPSNSRSKMNKKIREYCFAGVRAVWIVAPEDRSITVYREPDDGRILSGDKVISGEEIIPGFACKVAELFRVLPPLMVEDDSI